MSLKKLTLELVYVLTLPFIPSIHLTQTTGVFTSIGNQTLECFRENFQKKKGLFSPLSSMAAR